MPSPPAPAESGTGPAASIGEVLAGLDSIVARSIRTGSRLGYFATVYRTVTARVAEGIAEGFFDDGERMERLDVVFANRYLAAVAAHETRAPLTRSWQAACAAAERREPLVLQQLLVGINAHINLDLGIACAEVAPGDELAGLRRDFDRINEILASLLDAIQVEMARISPWLGLLDRIGGRTDAEVVRFSIAVARTQAWWFARELAALPRDSWGGPLGARDTRVARLARTVLHPGALRLGLLVIRARESNDVARNITVLGGATPPDLATVEARVRDERPPNA